MGDQRMGARARTIAAASATLLLLGCVALICFLSHEDTIAKEAEIVTESASEMDWQQEMDNAKPKKKSAKKAKAVKAKKGMKHLAKKIQKSLQKSAKKVGKGSKKTGKKDYGTNQQKEKKKVGKVDQKRLHNVATKQETIKETSEIRHVRQGDYGNEKSPRNIAEHKTARVGKAAADAVYAAAKKAREMIAAKRREKRKAAARAKALKEQQETMARRQKWAAEAKARADEKKQKKTEAHFMKGIIGEEHKRQHKKAHKSSSHKAHKTSLGEVHTSDQVAKNRLSAGADATRLKDAVNDPPSSCTGSCLLSLKRKTTDAHHKK